MTQPQYWNTPFPQWQQQMLPWSYVTQFQQNRGLLGPRPTSTPEANAVTEIQPTADFAQAFNTLTLSDPGAADWYMDSGAKSHLASSSGILTSGLKSNIGKSVMVGNGSSIPVIASGSSFLSSKNRPLSLSNVLVVPSIIKNLISVRKFTRDNWCSVEFDPLGFSVKDLQTGQTLLRSNNLGDLYATPAYKS